MINYTQSNMNKAAKQIDNELKKLLSADLKAFRIKSQAGGAPVVQLNLTPAA